MKWLTKYGTTKPIIPDFLVKNKNSDKAHNNNVLHDISPEEICHLLALIIIFVLYF